MVCRHRTYGESAPSGCIIAAAQVQQTNPSLFLTIQSSPQPKAETTAIVLTTTAKLQYLQTKSNNYNMMKLTATFLPLALFMGPSLALFRNQTTKKNPAVNLRHLEQREINHEVARSSSELRTCVTSYPADHEARYDVTISSPPLQPSSQSRM